MHLFKLGSLKNSMYFQLSRWLGNIFQKLWSLKLFGLSELRGARQSELFVIKSQKTWGMREGLGFIDGTSFFVWEGYIIRSSDCESGHVWREEECIDYFRSNLFITVKLFRSKQMENLLGGSFLVWKMFFQVNRKVIFTWMSALESFSQKLIIFFLVLHSIFLIVSFLIILVENVSAKYKHILFSDLIENIIKTRWIQIKLWILWSSFGPCRPTCSHRCGVESLSS